MNLSADDFDAFHRAVHEDRAPFEWQRRLVRQVVTAQRWPHTLDLPTGTGKTTCIDIAVFALALDAANAPAERWCPRRIAMVVDRRVVVDQAAERGRKLLAALTSPTDPVVIAVRNALASLSGESEPLAVFTLRGGIPKDDGWTRTPDQPLVIASTVDQIGSRLLIQGYGVSRGMRPVHAGLAGNDMLILLDEVHLSQPFKQTLEQLGSLRGRFAENGLPPRFQFAFLSATPGEAEERKFELTPAELDPDSPLGPRLHTRKPARIVEVSGREQIAVRMASEARSLLERHRVVVAVVNRVDTALAVAAAMRKESCDGADVVLLTGRMRPLDRDDVLATFRSRIASASRIRSDDEARLVVVGTQSIEAGADFDFDAIVTESASFDGLRQRFGRVDRLGTYRDDHGNGKAEGVIVHDKSEKDDPIYKETITETVTWLKTKLDEKRKTVDFGSRSLLDAPEDLLAPRENAPTLLPAYLDLWSQTAPEPSAVPDVGLFLHGPRSGPEDVQIIWRADLEKAALDEAGHDSRVRSSIVAAVGAISPSSLEAISLPFIVARRWLAGEEKVLEGTADLEIKSDGEREHGSGARRAVRWRGDDSEIIDASGVRPGDTLVMPSSYGGINLHSKSFDPDARDDVQDLAERASMIGRGRPLLRLHRGVLAGLGLSVDVEDPKAACDELATQAADLSGWRRPWLESLKWDRSARTVPWGENDGWVVLAGKSVDARTLRNALSADEQVRASVEGGVESTTDAEESPYVGSEVELAAHSRHVEEFARDFATRLGLSDQLTSDLSLAAWLHDIGKADPRFQRMLRGGSEIAYYRDEQKFLAKSGLAPGSKAAHRKALQLSGYPRGARHEVQSLAMIEAVREHVAQRAHDLDLVMHLVASHHGFCRPFAPAIDYAEPEVTLPAHKSETFGSIDFGETPSANELHRLDSPLADRFGLLMAQYGWLELCWLEAILRVADHRASEDEAGGEK